jgi:hypothetical protein
VAVRTDARAGYRKQVHAAPFSWGLWPMKWAPNRPNRPIWSRIGVPMGAKKEQGARAATRRRGPRLGGERPPTRWRTPGVPATVGLAITLAGSQASAQIAPPAPVAAPGSDHDFIRTLGCEDETLALKKGDELAAAGDFEAARHEYARAWTVWRLPNILFKRAAAEERSGHVIEAIASYGELMLMTEPDSTFMRGFSTYESHDAAAVEALRAEADRSLSELVEQVSELEIETPAGTRLTIDGHEALLRDGRILVTAGEHVLTATATGRTETLHVNCKGGATEKVTLLVDGSS